MKFIDLHLLIIAALGLSIFGFGFGYQLGVIGVFVVAQFVIVTRCLACKHRNWERFFVNEMLVALFCIATSLAINN